MEIWSVGVLLFHADGRMDELTETDMAKLIVTFRNFPKSA
jgi:hypothetical protein